MKSQLIIFLLSLSCPLISYSQVIFQKSIGGNENEDGRSIQQTNDGNFIIAGLTNSLTAGDYDVLLVKIENNGDTIWTKTYGGAADDFGHSVQQTTDGGYIIAGKTNSFGLGNADVLLIKTDSIGGVLWTKTYGGPGYDFGWSVQQTNDGGYIVTGLYNSFDVYLIKVDSFGNQTWTKNIGSANYDVGISVVQTFDGGYVVVGNTSFGAGDLDVYLIKLDSSGNVLWSKTFGGSGGDVGTCIKQTNNGGFIISGFTNSFGAGNYDFYLIKTNEAGDMDWSRTYGGPLYELSYSLELTTSGNFIIAGHTGLQFNNDVYLIMVDYFGNLLWTKTFGVNGDSRSQGVVQANDGGYIVVGKTGLSTSNLYIVKTDTYGNSGCYQGNISTSFISPATILTSPATIVSSLGQMTTPTVVVGNGGLVDTHCTTVDIKEVLSEGVIHVFPNPSRDFITGNLNTGRTIDLMYLTDNTGRKIGFVDYNVNDNLINISLEGLKVGIYNLVIVTEDSIWRGRFVKSE